MIVMKFGGTSNQDAAAMGRVLNIVSAHRDQSPVVVISAIAGGTNSLEATARTAAQGKEDEAVGIVTSLFDRHTRIVDNLISERQIAALLEAILLSYLNEIKALIKGIAILHELTPRTLDTICSYGERLSSRIIASGLSEMSIPTEWVDARDFMITDDAFGRARPLMDKVTDRLESRVRPLVERGIVPVTQGFIGVTLSGAYTTMGRESSDYSASIIGAAMRASSVQIWTDVDGILTADPRVVPDPLKLRRLSFEEAFELSYFGAKVLHPHTMLPLLSGNIPVQILNSGRPAGTGTRIDTEPAGDDAVAVRSIAHRSGLTFLALSPRQRLGQLLFWESVYSVLSRHGIAPTFTATSEYRLALALESEAVTVQLVRDLEEFGAVTVLPGQGSLCVVGRGMRERGGIADRVFGALGGMRVTMISGGASSGSLTLLLDESQLTAAVMQLHAEFFGREADGRVFEPLPR